MPVEILSSSGHLEQPEGGAAGTRATVADSGLSPERRNDPSGIQDGDKPVPEPVWRARRSARFAWDNMRYRCTRPEHPSWKYYGGRGINVCDRWLKSFEAFFADMGPRPTTAHTLERKDNEWHYQPDNCRWATRADQTLNRGKVRGRIFLTALGKTRSLSEWSRATGIALSTIVQRYDVGWTADEIVSTPVRRRHA